MGKLRKKHRILSMVLVLTLVFQLIPATAYAEPEREIAETEEATETGSEEAGTEETSDIEESAPETEESDETLENTAAEIVSEIVEKREENVKYYRMEDGTVSAAVYPYDVHYRDENGVFHDINNEMYDTDEDGEESYATKENEFQAVFSKKSRKHKLYTLRYGNKKIKVAIEGAEKTDAQVTETQARRKKNKIVLEHLNQEILYEDILENTDIRYVLQGKDVKENIVLKKKVPFQEIVYQYQLPDSMEAEQMDETTICIQNKDSKEIITYLSAPVMWDEQGHVSNGLTLTLADKTEKKVTITLRWDKEWVDSEETVFPVTIDPVISSSLARGDIQDTHVMKRYPNTVYGNVEHIRMGGTSDWRSYSMVQYTLPSLKSGEKVVSARMYLTPIRMVDPSASSLYSNENDENPYINITAHKINHGWDESTATYHNTIGTYDDFFADNAEDYCAVDGDGKVYSWDITKLVESWYSEANNGVLLQFDKDPGKYDWNAFFCSKNGYYTSPYAYPQFVVQYLNMTGTEDYFSSHIQNAGYAGTVYTNDLTGNLTLVNEIVHVGGGNMPVDVSLVYNTSDTQLSATPYGWGWKLNWAQCIRPTSLTAYKDSQTLRYYQYVDADGTSHYFLEDQAGSGDATDEINTGRKITYSASNDEYVMSDDSDTRMYFKKYEDEWYLYKTEDSYGNGITLTLGTTNRNRVTRIESTSGNEVLLEYSKYGFLQSVSYCLDEEWKTVNIGYNQHVDVPNNCISDIDYPDGNGADYYYYNDNNCISKVVDIDGYQMEYGYVKGNSCAPYRVYSVAEKGTDGSAGQKMSMSYGLCNTEITDVTNGRSYLYSFSETGTLKSVVDITQNDGNGYGQYYEYNEKKKTTSGKGNLTFESKTQKSTVNLLSNHSFEENSDFRFTVWNASSDEASAAYSSDRSMLGRRSVKLNGPSKETADRVLAYNYLWLEGGQTYTLSAYVNTNGLKEIEKGASLFVDGDGYFLESEYLMEITEEEEWKRLFLTFTPEVDGYASVCVSLTGAKGTVYFDNIQLEKGTLSEYNLLENAGFENGTDAWERSTGTYGVVSSEEHVSGESCAKLKGGANLRYDFMQELSISGKKGDAYVASAFGKAYAAPQKTWRFTLLVRFTDSNGEKVNDCNIDFNSNSIGWQKVSGAAVAKGDYEKISVWVLYYNNLNIAWFDNVQLIKDTFGYTYTYDQKGNIVSVADLMGQEEHTFQYDGASQLIKQTNLSGSRIFYTYDEKRKQQLTMVSDGGITTSYEYDSRGNAVLSHIESTEIADGNSYYIRNVNTGKYLTADGTKAVAEAFQGTDAQKWKVWKEKSSGEDSYFSLSPESALSLTLCAESSSLAAQGSMGLYESGKPYDTLKLVKKQENIYYLRFAENTDYAVDIYEEKAFVFPSHEGESQQFVLEPCSGNKNENHLTVENGAAYDKDGDLTMMTDSRGGHVSYSYLYNRGVVEEITDAEGNPTSYTYDEKNRLTSVTAEQGTEETSASYTYNVSDQITGLITPSGTQYGFQYDNFGRSKKIQAGERILRENHYDVKGLLTASIYGNGTTYQNFYDEHNRLTGIAVNGQEQYRLNYDGNGRLIQQEDIPNNQTVKLEYDFLDRLTTTRLIDGNSSKVVQMTETKYDSRNRVSGYDSFLEGQTRRTEYVYGAESQNPDLIMAVKLNGAEEASYEYDGLNRISQKKFADGKFTSSYTYEDGVSITNGNFYPAFCEGRTVGGDFNGDGRTDLAEMYDYSDDTVRIHIWLADGKGGYQNPEVAYFSEQFDASKVTGRMTSGDYDGDRCDEIATLYDMGRGRMELYVFQPETDASGAISLEKETWFSEMGEGCFLAYLVTGRVTSGDYDGDGKDEIAVMYDYGDATMRILVFARDNQKDTEKFSYYTRYMAAESGSYDAGNATERMVSGDYDGDGRDEIAVLYDKGSGAAAMQVFDGSGKNSDWYFDYRNWYEAEENTFLASHVSGTMVSGDFNGDGKEDIACLYDYTDFSRMLVFVSNGTDWKDGWQIWDGGTRNYHYDNARGRMSAGDWNGDGKEEILSLYAESESSLSIYIWEKKSDDSFRLKRGVWNSFSMVTDGEGTTTLIRTLSNGDMVRSYTYDENGNIQSVAENGKKQYDYHYDSLGQLVREDHARKETIVYQYDNGGNLLFRNYYAYTEPEEEPAGEPLRQICYEYGDTEWRDLLTSYNGESITYDGIGNPMTYTKGRTLTWENGRRLKSITDASRTSTYSYNAEGIRIGKTSGEETSRYMVNGSRILCEVRTDGTKVYFYYDESGSLLSMEYGGIMYYYGKNLQGDILRLVDGNGKAAAEYEYDSWGSLIAVKGENGEDIRNEAGHIGNINPFRYRGYYYDSETGFYYLGSRYYDPEVGRFISADTTDILGASGNLYDKNLYAYCDNNPVMRKDLDGQCWITVGIMAVGGVVGATVSAAGSAAIQKSLIGTVNWKSVAVAAASGFVSGAVAASPLGIGWQIRLGAGLGAASYIADCKVNKQEIAVDELAVSALVGGVSGAIGGPGANQDMVLTKTIQTSIKTANRMAARKCTAYAAKRIAATTAWRNNILIVSALGGSARFAAGIGISNGLTSGWTRIRSRVLNWFKR